MSALATIHQQIEAAKDDLARYQPAGMDWPARAVAAADQFIPWLTALAPQLRDYVQDVLNAPASIRSLWTTLRPHIAPLADRIAEFERLLALDDILRESVTGETVSTVVPRYLLDHPGPLALATNGRSDYPDVFRSTPGLYAQLPNFTRAKDEYGAALKGKAKRPVRVPDGLEIKTCRDRIAVDCHYPHAGLHLVVLFAEAARAFRVTDIKLAFLMRSDYRKSARNTDATTVKFSFNGDHFVSVLAPNPSPAGP